MRLNKPHTRSAKIAEAAAEPAAVPDAQDQPALHSFMNKSLRPADLMAELGPAILSVDNCLGLKERWWHVTFIINLIRLTSGFSGVTFRV